MTIRIAMWSGPRNISTAMMRSWGNRPDTFVCDEPLYAHYLEQTGLDHPGAQEVIAHHESDWRVVVDMLVGSPVHGRAIFYQKHMAHHLLPDMDRDWLSSLTNCFLIRDPREMVTSLIKRYADVTIEDTGLPQQVEIFETVRSNTGSVPPVLDARDVLTDPRGMLTRLCHALGVAFLDDMLTWPAGPRDTDGIWAKHWYDAVNESTGFKPFSPKNEPVPSELQPQLDQCMEYYNHLAAFRMT